MSTWLATLTKPSVTNEPPSEGELRRIDLAVLITIIFALFLGFGIRNNAVGASRTIELGEGLPSIKVPSNWITGQPEGMLFRARNPRSASIFNAEVSVMTRPLAAGQDAVAARTSLGLQRTQELLRYRELAAEPVTVNGQPGILVTYAYVADPTRAQGAIAPPVVVQAQDLIFPSGSNAVIVTIAADAATWDNEQAAIDIIQDSLNMRIQNSDVVSEFEEGGE
ncbi:MAG: hypothetical protein IT328_01795 [Caldilineaceae bacterium]|nr:hypothetical protein [Caldilineaceae bacterium]